MSTTCAPLLRRDEYQLCLLCFIFADSATQHRFHAREQIQSLELSQYDGYVYVCAYVCKYVYMCFIYVYVHVYGYVCMCVLYMCSHVLYVHMCVCNSFVTAFPPSPDISCHISLPSSLPPSATSSPLSLCHLLPSLPMPPPPLSPSANSSPPSLCHPSFSSLRCYTPSPLPNPSLFAS